jgi:hypothetical protein
VFPVTITWGSLRSSITNGDICRGWLISMTAAQCSCQTSLSGVLEVRLVLRVRTVADVDVLWPFVDVADPVEVQEVGDQPFAVAL